MKPIWLYNNWDGRYLMIGGDEYFRKTLVVRLPFTTRAVVIPVSRVGKLYDPQDCPDEKFERWQRSYHPGRSGGLKIPIKTGKRVH